MSDRKISAAFYEALGTPAEVVVPRALPAVPPLPIVADWIDNVEISTTWRTDVTRSVTKDEEERRALLTRPVRQLTATLTGRNNEETHTLAQQVMNYAYSNAPAPIYCDQAFIESASGTTIYCDTRFRRIHIGQRVIIQSERELTKQSDNLVQWAVVADVANNYVVLSSAPARAPVRGDLLIPCMDVQVTTETSGSLIVDNVLQVQVSWMETPGPESIPASHPPLSYDNLNGLVAYADGIPVFDLPPNWIDGIQTQVLRRAESDGLGKGTSIFAQGSPYHRFALTMMAKDRETAWAQQRFFDAMQGRCGQFYLLSFNDPWVLDATPFPTTSACRIKPIGSHEEIALHFRHAAFTRANGEVVVRQIQSVVDGGTYYGITLASALPDTNFVSIKPAHLCRLDSDTYTATWVTDQINESEFEIVEIRTFSGSAFDYPSLLHFSSYRTPTTIAQSSPHIWFDATANSYTTDKETNYSPPNRKLAASWPSFYNEVVNVFDVREALPSETTTDWSIIKRPYLSAVETSASIQPVLIRFADFTDNDGKPAIAKPRFALNFPNSFGNQLPRTQDLWSTADGWTLIFAYTPPVNKPATAVEAELIQIEGSPSIGQPAVSLFAVYTEYASSPSLVSARQVNGVYRTFNPSLPLVQNLETESQILVIRYDAGLSTVELIKNGLAGGSTTLAVGQTLVLPSSYTKQEFGRAFNTSLPLTKTALTKWGVYGSLNTLLSYRTKLTNAQLNNVGLALADASGGRWTNLP